MKKKDSKKVVKKDSCSVSTFSFLNITIYNNYYQLERMYAIYTRDT